MSRANSRTFIGRRVAMLRESLEFVKGYPMEQD